MPAELSIKLDDKRFRRTMERFKRQQPQQRRKGMLKGGSILVRSIHKKIGGEGFTRNPSRTSKYPGVLTGTMYKTIYAKVDPKGTWLVVGPGGAASKYAAALEFGASITQTVSKKQHWYLGLAKGIWIKTGSTLNIRIPPRPFLGDTLKEEVDKVMKIIFGEVVRPLRR